jgi:hypothetical protein
LGNRRFYPEANFPADWVAEFRGIRIVQAQGIKAHRVFGVIRAPLPVGDLLHGLEGIVVALRAAPVDEGLG